MEGLDAFERDFLQLKPYYIDAGDEITGCSEKAYDYLSIRDVQQTFFTSDQELSEYMKEEHPEWEIKKGSVFFQKAKETAPSKEITSLQLINQTLSYASEL